MQPSRALKIEGCPVPWGDVTAPPLRFDHLVARNVAELRRERGWTQPDLAWRMDAMGLGWTANRVTQLETLRRAVSPLEMIALSWVFGVPLVRLLSGDEDIVMPDGKTLVPAAHIRAALTGDTTVQQQARAEQRARANIDEVRKIAKGLEIEPRMLDWLAHRLYNRPFTEERDARAGDLSHMPPRSARSKRGHVSRTLSAEIADYIDRHGRDALVTQYRRYQREKHEQVVARLRALQRREGD